MSLLSPGSDCDAVERTPEQEAHHIIRRIRQHVLLLDRQWTGVNHVSNDWQQQIDETLEVKFKLKSLRYCRLSRFWLILPPYNVFQLSIIIVLAGHPRSGCPARLRGHKGSGLWKVWTVPSPPLPCPPLPCPPLPSPPLPSPPLPCPVLPSPPPSPPLPSLPPSLPRAKFDQAGSSRLAEITARRSARV